MELIQFYAKGQIKPHIDKVYTLENSQQALVDMMDRKVMGKIVIEP
jgi:NADPH2:quinone reductase